MISKIIKSRTLLTNSTRHFAAINASSFSLDSVSKQDLLDSEPRSVGAVLAAMQADSTHRSDLCDSVDEYFRKNFRKLSFEDARHIVNSLGHSTTNEVPSKI